MYIAQAELFQGMDKGFIKQVMDITAKESYEKGHMLFNAGDPADHFYILLKGHVRLTLGGAGELIHLVSRPGEIFGWSSIVGRESYSASAECTMPTKLLKLPGKELQHIVEKDPANGLIFYKRLARTLGGRLLQTYKMISSSSLAEVSPSYGTGDHLLESSLI